MFDVSDDLQAILQSRSRDLIYVYEIYAWNYTPFPESTNFSYDPRHAIALFAGQNISFTWGDDTIIYEREVLSGPSIKKSIEKQFDTVSIRFSNVSRRMASFVLNNRIEGMRLVVRAIPRSANALSFIESSHSPFIHSIIEFVGRIKKPDGFKRSVGTISATQDLGTIQVQIPETDFQPICPLVRVFKKPGFDCMGDQTLSEKSATYQAAKSCNGTEAQCLEYENEKYFQGTKLVQLTSSFVHKSKESFFKKVLNILPGISRKKTTVGNSIFEGAPYGSPWPIILGRWLQQLIPLQYQDLGNTINFKEAACRGPIKDFLNIHNNAPNFSQPGSIIKHLGEFGGVGTQTQDLLFPGGQYHSKLAYITGSCTGSDIEVEDPAPDIFSLIAGSIVRQAYGTGSGLTMGTGRITNIFAGYSQNTDGWSDNPVDQAVYLYTEFLNLPLEHIAEKATARSSAYTTGAIKDASNAERCLLPNTEASRAGVDYKRYNSTGLVGALNFHGVGLEFLNQAQSPGGVPDREAEYEFFDPDSPPTSLDVKTVYRKRFTSNLKIDEKKKVVDLIHDTLYPAFRGFNRWDQHGRLVIDCERPADHSFLRADAVSTATSIKVLDVTPWKPLEGLLGEPEPLRGKLLIGAHKLTSEVRPVTTAQYSADGDAIEYSSSATGGLSAVSGGSTLTGGSSSDPSTGTVTISGTPAVGDQISITIDGFTITITATQEDVDATIPNLTLAAQMIFAINAEPGLKEYVEANRGSSGGSSTDVVIICKYGVLNFSTALQEDHFAEIAAPVDAPTASASAGALSAGVYQLSYAWRNANGNTNFSPILAIELADDEQIDVDAVTLPAGADSVDWFISVEADSDIMVLVLNNDGSAFSINALPLVTSEHAPNRNTTGEETLRVMMSFAGKALTYADTTRANILDGTFTWPEGSKQSTVNQVKGEHKEAIQDFAKQTLIVNDERHQEETGEINSATVDLSAVDNHNQAKRLLNGYLAKLRDGDFFFSWGSAGEALLLEIGDVVCASDDSGAWRNVPMRVEEAQYNSKFEVSLDARLYSDSQFDDEVIQTEVPLPSGLSKTPLDGPDAPASLTLAQIGTYGVNGTYDTKIIGTITFADSLQSQRAQVYVTPPSESEVFSQTLLPGQTTFEIAAPKPGLYSIRVVAASILGAPGGEITQTITVGNVTQTISPPTSVAASIVDGRATITWAAPSTNPERVTGYIVYAADGTTVLMAKAKVFEWKDPRTAGSYTVKVAAADDMGNQSTLVSVSYTTTTLAGGTATAIDAEARMLAASALAIAQEARGSASTGGSGTVDITSNQAFM